MTDHEFRLTAAEDLDCGDLIVIDKRTGLVRRAIDGDGSSVLVTPVPIKAGETFVYQSPPLKDRK